MPSTSIRKSEYDPVLEFFSVWFVASRKRCGYEAVSPKVYSAFPNA